MVRANSKFCCGNHFHQIHFGLSSFCFVLIKQIITLGDNTKLFLQGKTEEALKMNQTQISEMKAKFLGTTDFNDRSKLTHFCISTNPLFKIFIK